MTNNTSNAQACIQVPSHVSPRFKYSVKIVNPKKKSEYEIQVLRTDHMFTSVEELKTQIVQDCESKVPEKPTQLGFIEPGHGLRGKQRWINSEDDLKEMYHLHKGKDEIILWCFHPVPSQATTRPGLKRPREGDTLAQKKSKGSRYEQHVDKMMQVKQIEEQLQEKHSGQFTPEQIRAWAHYNQSGKYDSLDVPPNLPFWRDATNKAKDRQTVPLSPGKRVTMRGQCVDQLSKWHDLLEKGAITNEQYTELKSTILDDVKKL